MSSAVMSVNMLCHLLSCLLNSELPHYMSISLFVELVSEYIISGRSGESQYTMYFMFILYNRNFTTVAFAGSSI